MRSYFKTALAAMFLMAPSAVAQDHGAAPANPPVDAAERAKIESVLQDYLMENPEIIMLAIKELQRRNTVAQMKPTIDLYRGYLEHEENAPVIGNPNGDVTIVEFFDYRCGYCRRHFPAVAKLVAEDGNIRWIPRQFPILDRPDAPQVSLMAAKAAVAAHRQGKFGDFHAAMMMSQQQVTEDSIYRIAASVGLDVTQLKADMADKILEKKVQNELSIGHDIGFEGTPGYIVGDDVVLGAEGYDRLKEAVARARSQLAQNNSGTATQ